MKILIFTEYYYPENFLIHEIAEELVERGNQVTVITGKPNYHFPRGRVPASYKKISFERINGVDVHRCSVPGRGTNKLCQLYNYFIYAKNAKKLSRTVPDDFDIVFCYQMTPVIQLIPAIDYAARNHKKLFCYCLDLAPLSGEAALKFFPMLKRLYAKKSREYYRACDRIAVTSEAFIPYLQQINGIDAERLIYLPQHASQKLLGTDQRKAPNGSIDFLFAGNIGEGAKLETVIDAVGILKAKGIDGFHVHIVGDGSAKNALIRYTGKKHLTEYIRFHDAVPMEDMPSVYARADALIVTLWKGQLAVPGKLQAYMSTGKCILGAMDGSGRSVIETSGCGLCADAEDTDGLAAIMEQYISAPAVYDKLGENGKRYFHEHFTLDIFMQGLTACLTGTENSIPEK